MKQMTLMTLAAAVVATLAAISPALAHHSHAMFDVSKVTEITGVVTAVRYANPHVYLQMQATHRDGKPLEPNQTWAIEMSTVQNMAQRGITPNLLPYGTTVVVKVNPLFSGGPSGNYTNMVMINGVKNTSTEEDWKPAAATPR